MTELTSARSPRVLAARRLAKRAFRARDRRFLAEGPQAVREALLEPGTVVELFHTGEAAAREPRLLDSAAAAGVATTQVSAEVMKVLAQTVTPQGVVAVCHLLDRPLAEAVGPGAQLIAVLAHGRDPGNAGTVIRGADAAGADAVLVRDASVDVLSPKVVRSTAGSLFHLPVVAGLPVEGTIDRLREAGIRVLAADGAGTVLLPEVDLAPAHAWVMGNEAWGLEEAVRDRCDEVVRVPIHGKAESLNLAMAATVCLYASAAAQRG
jgi:RNA methyltransferase, TrmH family